MAINLVFARWRRRTKIIVCLGADILQGRGAMRCLTPASWAFVAGWAGIVGNLGDIRLCAASAALFVHIVILSLIDVRYLILPDGPLVFLCVAAFFVHSGLPYEEAVWFLVAGVIAAAAFLTIGLFFEWLLGRPGLGVGDAWLFGVAGLWVGMDGLLSCLLISVFSALLASWIGLRDRTLSSGSDMAPYGPHIGLGLWLTWTIGPLVVF